MTRAVPIIFNQQHFLQLLGFSNVYTIASSGCYVSSLAMLARYYGKTIDPVDLNSLFKSQTLFVAGTAELSSDGALQQIFPDILFQESFLFPDEVKNPDGTIQSPAVPADLTKLTQLVNDPTLSVILEIDLGGGNTHFVVCLGVNGVVTIANPWDGQQEDFAKLYGDPVTKIIKFVVYKGTPASVDQQLLDQLRQQRDNNWNLYQGEIVATQTTQEQLATIQKELTNANKTNAGLKAEISQANQQSSNLALELANKNKEDSTAIDTGAAAETQLDDLISYFTAIAKSMGIALSDKYAQLTDSIITNYEALNTALKNRDDEIKQLKTQNSPAKKLINAVKSPTFWDTIYNCFLLQKRR